MPRTAGRLVSVLACLVATAGCDQAAGPKQTPSGAAGTGAPPGPAGTSGGGQTARDAAAGGGQPAPDAAAGRGSAPPASDDGAAPEAPPGGSMEAAPPAPDGASGGAGTGGTALPKTALLFTSSAGGYRHESIEPAAAALKNALALLGITGEIGNDPTVFTAAGLARFGVVVLI